jgi:hypothetical protein
MSLLKLTPESERLRRIAKAHAAGEIAQDEFRRIRSSVIDGFGEDRPCDLGDDTQRRWLGAETTTQPFMPVAEGAMGVGVPPKAFASLKVLGLVLLVVALALAGAATALALPPEKAPVAGDEPDAQLVPVHELGVDRLTVPRLPFGVPALEPPHPTERELDEHHPEREFAHLQGRA